MRLTSVTHHMCRSGQVLGIYSISAQHQPQQSNEEFYADYMPGEFFHVYAEMQRYAKNMLRTAEGAGYCLINFPVINLSDEKT